MGATSSTSPAQAEIIAIAGPEALTPPIENPHDERWDMLLGSKEVDFFKDYVPTTSGVKDPVKELAAVGVMTQRDMAIVGISDLVSLPEFGARSILKCWQNMRNAEPPMSRPFRPGISAVVRLSLGDLDKVPIVAATRQWLSPAAYRKYGAITVARAYELIDSGPRAIPVPDEAKDKFISSVSRFGKAFTEEKKRQESNR